MEEITNYLHEISIDVLLQEICENHRIQSSTATISTSTDTWTNSISLLTPSTIKKKKFSSGNLKKSDPSHWTTTTGTSLQSMNSILIPDGYSICIDWKIFIQINQTTDTEGWQYNTDFQINGWTNVGTLNSQVRHRKWERLLVLTSQLAQAKQRVMEFTSHKREYRSFNPQLIYCALKQTNYRIQYLLECQRLSFSTDTSPTQVNPNSNYYQEGGRTSSTGSVTSNYSELHLQPTDPSHWSMVSPSLYPTSLIASVDPTTVFSSQLCDAYQFFYANPYGTNTLHEFIFSLYPNKDAMGWEYNTSFDQINDWSSSPKNRIYTVRRRLWFRTLVPMSLIYSSRDLLSNYIQSHPRGLVYQGTLQRISQYRKRWTNGIGRVMNSDLTIQLENNYQSNYTFSLLNCEVHPLDSVQDLQKYQVNVSTSASSSNGFVSSPSTLSWNELAGIGTSTPRNNLFCLCNVNASGQIMSIQVIFNAVTQQERILWMTILSHQIALYNLSFWPIPLLTPPLVDTLVYQGELYKRGHVVQNWKLRKFELSQRGILSYYAGNDLKGRIRLRGCLIDWNHPVARSEIILKKLNGYELVLKGKNTYELTQWMNELLPYIGMECDERPLFPTLGLDNLDRDSLRSDQFPIIPHHHISYEESSLPSPPRSSQSPGTQSTMSEIPIPTIHSTRISSTEYFPEEETTYYPSASVTHNFPEEDLPPLLLPSDGTPHSIQSESSVGKLEPPYVDPHPVFIETQEGTVEIPGSNSTHSPDFIENPEGNTETSGSHEPTATSAELNPFPVEATQLNSPESRLDIPLHSGFPAVVEIRVDALDFHSQNTEIMEENILDVDRNQFSERFRNNCNPNLDKDPTHELIKDQKGRRVSLLNSNVLDLAEVNAIWGGNDSDESDSDISRSNSFSDQWIGDSRPLSLKPSPNIPQAPPPPTESSTERTHELLKDQHGRRVSVLNSNVVNIVEEKMIWGGDDSDDSDGDESSRSSSFSELRPTSVRSSHLPVGRNRQSDSPSPEPANRTETSDEKSTPRTFSSMFGFGTNRRRSL